MRGGIPGFRGSSQPRVQDAGTARQTWQVFVLVPLLHAPGLRVDACADPNLVSLPHADLHQRPRMAGTANGSNRPGLPTSRQQVHRRGGLCQSPNPLGSAGTNAMVEVFAEDRADGASGASAVAGTVAGRLLLVGLPKRVGP